MVRHQILPPDVVVALERGGSQLDLGVALQADVGALPVDDDVDNDDDGVDCALPVRPVLVRLHLLALHQLGHHHDNLVKTTMILATTNILTSTSSSTTICQKCAKDSGCGAWLAMKVCSIPGNLILLAFT